eukprot:scaffold34208_cov72-Phaeocystis_antarctica.AAC.2
MDRLLSAGAASTPPGTLSSHPPLSAGKPALHGAVRTDLDLSACYTRGTLSQARRTGLGRCDEGSAPHIVDLMLLDTVRLSSRTLATLGALAHPEQRLDRALLLEDRHLPSLLQDLAADRTSQAAATATNSSRSLRLFANKTNF